MIPIQKWVLWGVVVLGLAACSLPSATVRYQLKKPEAYPVLQAIGYAIIDIQPGLTPDERMLQALRASKLDAYREMTEQLYGQMITGESGTANMMQQSSSLEAKIKGLVRGARVVRSYAQDNIYTTELQLDTQTLHQIYQVLGTTGVND